MSTQEKAVERVWVRVAINMARVSRGQHLLIDPQDKLMKKLLKKGCLVLLEEDGS